jgi:hypothetical protein
MYRVSAEVGVLFVIILPKIEYGRKFDFAPQVAIKNMHLLKFKAKGI